MTDIGNADQLTSTRAENAVLSAKCKELTEKVKELTLENQKLLAEVEMYRRESSLSANNSNGASTSISATTGSLTTAEEDEEEEAFVCSGNGMYPTDPAVTLSNLHGISNPLCCSLNADDTLLATGGADAKLTLCQWGSALAPTEDAAKKVVEKAIKIACNAPVICVGVSQQEKGSTFSIVAAGCMDGSIKLVGCATTLGLEAKVLVTDNQVKHGKYVKGIAWSPIAPLLATASADGTVILSKVSDLHCKEENADSLAATVDMVQSFHLPGAVESLCFSNDGNTLYCYARGTPYLSCFDMSSEDDNQQKFKMTKMNLNGTTTGGFQDHVSFAVLDMSPSPENKYLALATDTSRNIILNVETGKQVRNLYGHQNDGFSQPKIAWSHNGQYIFGNTQQDNSLVVWDIASSQIVERIDDTQEKDGHSGQIRCIYSSKESDTIVTTSFDKSTKIWLTAI